MEKITITNKETHDIEMSWFAPTHCKICGKSGYELDREPCHYYKCAMCGKSTKIGEVHEDCYRSK